MRAAFSHTSPEVGDSKPAIMRSVVVFPQPDGPSSEKNSPRRISSETSFTAVCVGNRFDTFRSSRIGVIVMINVGQDSILRRIFNPPVHLQEKVAPSYRSRAAVRHMRFSMI